MSELSARSESTTFAANTPATYHETMSIEEWESIPDNPRQRDTESHLKLATHLRNTSATHQHVAMAICLATGERWKLDGHTRALLWKNEPEFAPEFLHVTIYPVANVQEAAELYTHFDNKFAAETVKDKLSGALHEVRWNPQSIYFKNSSFTTSIAIAEGAWRGQKAEVRLGSRKSKSSIYDVIPNWLPELQALDGIDPVGTRFKSYVLTAALLTLRRRGIEKGLEFWRLYNKDEGIKLEGEIDGVEMLSRIVSSTRSSRRSVKDKLLGRAISCFESWRTGYNYSVKANSSSSGGGSAKASDPVKYISPVAIRAGVQQVG